MKDINNKFNVLTSDVLKHNEQIYDNALDYAFSNSDIKNIAITGIYGAGKSTVWKTYVNKKNLQRIITVSLGKYEDDTESNSTEDKNENAEEYNRIERQMINQMLSQVEASKIPLFSVK